MNFVTCSPQGFYSIECLRGCPEKRYPDLTHAEKSRLRSRVAARIYIKQIGFLVAASMHAELHCSRCVTPGALPPPVMG